MIDRAHRRAWAERRRHLEERLWTERLRHTPEGQRVQPDMGAVMAGIGTVVRLSGMFGRGRRNALDVRLTEVEFRFPHLPAAFDGYRILFLSDLHVGDSPGNMAAALPLLEGLSHDLAVLGGDYQSWGKPAAAETARCVAPLLAALRPPDGVVAVLGNHDSHELVEPLEALGVRLLLNESVAVTRGDQSIHLIGCDDVHMFYDHAAEAALRHGGGGFRVALVHSPDFAGQAAAAGCALYLAGHTHGGQICLPGGRPVVTGLDRHHGLARGAWRLHAMQGYTSTGLGSGEPALRFNCPPEVARVTLKKGASV